MIGRESREGEGAVSKTQKEERPTAIDLFAGCGGVTTGLRAAGFHVLAAVENDPAAATVFRKNHRRVELFGDITQVNLLSLKRRLGLRKGRLSLLAGCPPCQGFSTMTTLNGRYKVDDDRNALINYFGHFVADLLPETVMLENVPGLGSERRFALFRGELQRLGYQAHWQVVDARDYGVPQRRRRLVLMASRHGMLKFPGAADEVVTVRDAIARLPKAGTSGDDAHDVPECRSPEIQKLIKDIPKDGGSRSDLGTKRQLKCHKRCDGFKDVYGRMAWDDVSPTITSGCFNPSKGRFLHPVENRCITMREAALLQSFPENYRLPMEFGKQAIACMIGNALPPEMVRRFAGVIRVHLRSRQGSLVNRRQGRLHERASQTPAS